MTRYIYTILLLCFTISSAIAQIPCIQKDSGQLAARGDTKQSSTDGIGESNIAIDGIKVGYLASGTATQTLKENNAWWEIDLGEIYALESIKIWYPSDAYPQGFYDYYILYSTHPFSSTDLATVLSNPEVNYLQIESSFPSGNAFPLQYESARYVRIQISGGGILALTEVEIPGRIKEICGNDCDDDGDGFTDCDDSDCAPNLYNVSITDPSCPICPDGEISIQAFGENIEYSIDGGQSYAPFCSGNFQCPLDNLLEGDYEILIRNDHGCEVEWSGNPIQLRGPSGGAHGHCFNGGFEEGTWEDWKGKFGNRESGLHRNGFNPDRHNILSAGDDPFVPITIPFSGTYTVKLGDNKSLKHMESITYCFTVDDTNKDFSFNYAIVLETPAEIDDNDNLHGPDKESFFQYDIYSMNSLGERETIPDGFLFETADADEFYQRKFLENNPTPLAYKGWTCEAFDLSNYLGQELCVEFIVADCSEGGHFGYAYIDGLCTAPADNEPILSFEAKNVYCENQKIEVDATKSSGFNQYSWEVCILGSTFCIQKSFVDYEIGIFDVSQFILDNGGSINCGDALSVRLTVENDCASPISIEKTIEYECAEYELSYKDVFICGKNALVDVALEGDNDCTSCTYEWKPQVGLNNAKSEFPIVLGSILDYALKQNYEVTATSPEGCLYEERINIYRLPEVEFLVRDDLDYCDRSLWVALTYDQPIHKDWIFIEFENRATGEILNTQFKAEISTEDIFYFAIDANFSTPTWIDVRVGWNVSSTENIIVELAGDCQDEYSYQLIPNDLFRGDFIDNMAVPNIFTPELDINNFFGPVVDPNSTLGSNVYWAKIRIWNRWGQNVHEMEFSSIEQDVPPPNSGYNTPLDVELIAWDGKQINPLTGIQEWAAQDVYLYDIWFANCTYPDKEANHNSELIKFSGNVTLCRSTGLDPLCPF